MHAIVAKRMERALGTKTIISKHNDAAQSFMFLHVQLPQKIDKDHGQGKVRDRLGLSQCQGCCTRNNMQKSARRVFCTLARHKDIPQQRYDVTSSRKKHSRQYKRESPTTSGTQSLKTPTRRRLVPGRFRHKLRTLRFLHTRQSQGHES